MQKLISMAPSNFLRVGNVFQFTIILLFKLSTCKTLQILIELVGKTTVNGLISVVCLLRCIFKEYTTLLL